MKSRTSPELVAAARRIDQNRTVKAVKIAAYLQAAPSTTAAEASMFSDADWSRVGERLGFDHVSEVTRDRIVAFMQYAEATAVLDPFRGLPTGGRS